MISSLRLLRSRATAGACALIPLRLSAAQRLGGSLFQPSVCPASSDHKRQQASVARSLQDQEYDQEDEDEAEAMSSGIQYMSSNEMFELGLPKIYLIGRTGRDVEIRNTTTGKQVGNVGIAVNTRDSAGMEVTEWYNLVMWEDMARLAANIPKGTMVAITGRPGISRWNNNEKLDVTVSNLFLVDGAPNRSR